MIDRIMAPCHKSGLVNSIWSTNPDGGPPGEYDVIDNDSKEAECRCPLGSCCVDGRNCVIQGIVLNVGGPQKVRELLDTQS